MHVLGAAGQTPHERQRQKVVACPTIRTCVALGTAALLIVAVTVPPDCIAAKNACACCDIPLSSSEVKQKLLRSEQLRRV
jgi:hypothetical protein